MWASGVADFDRRMEPAEGIVLERLKDAFVSNLLPAVQAALNDVNHGPISSCHVLISSCYQCVRVLLSALTRPHLVLLRDQHSHLPHFVLSRPDLVKDAFVSNLLPAVQAALNDVHPAP